MFIHSAQTSVSFLSGCPSYSRNNKIPRLKALDSDVFCKSGSVVSFSSQDIQPSYDSFTEMGDKNYLLASLNKVMRQKQKKGDNVSIAMFDMDNFKSVNEFLGYKTGDDFIKEIANGIKKVAVQHGITPYRFGGEEFVMVFDKQSEEEETRIVKEIVHDVNSNEFFKSKTDEYFKNAHTKLSEYEKSNEKINSLMYLKTKKQILNDLKENFSTEEAKNDPYLKKETETTEEELKTLYGRLLGERISNEPNGLILSELCNVKQNLDDTGELPEEELSGLDKYLKSVYDKTLEIAQIKKWLSDFGNNGGFSITGGVVSYSPACYENKTSIDIINESGEFIKESKMKRKGRCFFVRRI